MSERENHLGRKESSASLGIEFPQGPLPPDVMTSIVQGSQARPLREIVARFVISESRQLWQKYKPFGYDTDPNPRNAQDIALNEGYYRAGRFVLVASSYMSDGAAAVCTQIRPIQMFDMLESVTPDNLSSLSSLEAINERIRDSQTESTRNLTSHLQRDLTDEMREAIESLTIDPTGVDWLKRWLAIEASVWNSIHRDRHGFDTEEDPQVLGLRRGIERYKDAYSQVVTAGAIQDKTESKRKQVVAKMRRGVKQGLYIFFDK